MLTISGALSAVQAQTYHAQQYSNAKESYYTEGARVDGQWQGRLAAALGLDGAVNEQQFVRMTEGQHPETGEQLVRNRASVEYTDERGKTVKTVEHRAGWDATFSAPKSVSLTALVGGDERIVGAHREAVIVALRELEAYGQARLADNQAETTGRLAIARFEHTTARPVEGYAAPQLHTHAVIFNMTETADGKTHALQERNLFATQSYATAVYRNELARSLQTLGYEIECGKHNEPQIKGYSEEYLRAQSPRRQEIEEHLAALGLKGAAAAQIAAHQTRSRKMDLSPEEVRRQHLAMSRQHGSPEFAVVRLAQERQHGIEQQPDRTREAIGYAIERGSERSAVLDERQVMRDALNHAQGQVKPDSLRAELTRRVEQGEVIRLERRAHKITTREAQEQERGILRKLAEGQGREQPLVSPETQQQVIKDHAHLSASQCQAVKQILSNRDQLQGLEGVAGAGKTTSLVAIREAAEREGYTVQGLAPTSRAAQKLGEAGMETETLQKHLARGEGVHGGVEKRLYVIDETSLTSTKQVYEFLHRLSSNERVLFVGDTRQHEAVEAGRPFAQLKEAGMEMALLDEIRRQKDPELKAAVEQLARGEVKEAVQSLASQNRVVEIGDAGVRFERMAAEYSKAPDSTLIISPDNKSRAEINERIHALMKVTGEVRGKDKEVKTLMQRQDLTGADRKFAQYYEPGDVVRYAKKSTKFRVGEYARVVNKDAVTNLLTVERENGKRVSYDPARNYGVQVYREAARKFAEGERVQFTAPNYEQKIANRELGAIGQIGRDGTITVKLDSGREVKIGEKEQRHIDYGYAVTSHSSQGQTASRVLINVDSENAHKDLLNERMAYVSVSRAAQDAKIFTDNAARLDVVLSRDVSHEQALERGIGAQPLREAVEEFKAELMRQGEAFSKELPAKANAPQQKIETPEHTQVQQPAKEIKAPKQEIEHGMSLGF
jgi:conjugative relaxase-like TrwC/TraI family protein